MKKLHALVLGATGATGKEIVKLLLEDSNFSKVSLFVRRKIHIEHKKLTVHKIDFSKLSEYNSNLLIKIFLDNCINSRIDKTPKTIKA